MNSINTATREFCIYFHGSLLRAVDHAGRHRLARLAHYFRFHYDCRTLLWNPEGEVFQRWHPAVISPIPYPQIDMVAKIEGEGPHLVFSAQEEEGKVSQWLEQCPETAVFTLARGHNDSSAIVAEIEKALESVLSSFRRQLAPGQKFYDIHDGGEWEEVFLHRVDAPPLDDPDFRKYGPFVALRELEYAWSLGQIDKSPGVRTLDVGSYTTWVPRYLSEKGLDVISLDLDPEAIVYQKDQSAKSAKPFEVIHADSTKIPLPNESVDQILAISTVEHFPDRGDSVAMREYHRILRPGGLVVITVPYDHYWHHLDTGVRPGAGLQRYYSMEAAVSRLVLPPMFEIVALEFIGGTMLEIGKFIPDYRNPTNAHLLCISLRKAERRD